ERGTVAAGVEAEDGAVRPDDECEGAGRAGGAVGQSAAVLVHRLAVGVDPRGPAGDGAALRVLATDRGGIDRADEPEGGVEGRDLVVDPGDDGKERLPYPAELVAAAAPQPGAGEAEAEVPELLAIEAAEDPFDDRDDGGDDVAAADDAGGDPG